MNQEYLCPYCQEDDIEAEVTGTAYWDISSNKLHVDTITTVDRWYCLNCEFHIDEPLTRPYVNPDFDLPWPP